MIAASRFDDVELRRSLDTIDDDALLAAAQHHHVVSFLHERLSTTNVARPHLVDALRTQRLQSETNRLRLRLALAVLAAALGDLPWLMIKGRILASWYPDPSTRDFNDLDIVVGAADFSSAIDRLHEAEITVIGENWRGYRDYEVGEVPLRYKHALIDLHWHVVALGRQRRSIELPTRQFFERAVPGSVENCNAMTFDDVDTLVHLCVNAGLGGGRRLRSLLDVDAVMRSGRVDLDEFARRAKAAQIGPLAGVFLQRAAVLLDTPVPSELLQRLAGSQRLALSRAVDRNLFGHQRGSRGLAPGILISSSRDSIRGTGRAVARSIVEAAAVRTGRPALTDPGGALDWQRPATAGRASAEREEYLKWVATMAEQ